MKNWKNPERTTKIKPFINKHNWESITFLSEKWLEMFGMLKRKNISCLCFKKITQIMRKKIPLSMIPIGKRWHYLAVKRRIIKHY